MAITRRYVHPQDETIRKAIDRAQQPKQESAKIAEREAQPPTQSQPETAPNSTVVH